MTTIFRTLGTTAALVLTLAASASAQQRIDERLATGAGGSVEVINLAGSVRVTGWDRDEIQITGTLGRGAERVEVTPNGNRTEIRVVLPREGRNVQGSDLEVRVPARKDVIVRTVSADIEVAEIGGAVQGRSVSGSVRVVGSPRQVIAGSTSGSVEVNAARTSMVQANTVSGSIKLRGAADENVSVESISGSVDVSVSTPETRAKTVSGSVEVQGVGRKVTASTVSGSLRVSADELEYGSFQTVSGDIRLNGRVAINATLDFQSHSGDIDLQVPRETAADFEIRAMNGDIRNAFGPAVERMSRYGPGRELRFSNGRGGARVMVKTFSGDVTLGSR